MVYATTGLPQSLSFDATTRTVSGTPSATAVATVVVSASNAAGQVSGQFTITVSPAPVVVVPTGPATLTITSFTCITTNAVLTGVDFVIGYSDGTFLPTVPDLFLNGLTITGQLGQLFTLNFDANQSSIAIQDQATRSTYFTWNYRAACTAKGYRVSNEPMAAWRAVLLGNPPVNDYAEMDIQDAAGLTLQLMVSDITGRIIGTQSVEIDLVYFL